MRNETKKLFGFLDGKFNDNVLREIVLASEGLKIARTCLMDWELEFLLPAAKVNGLQLVVSDEKYLHRRDIGKGGWSNSLAAEVGAEHPEGLFNVYLAADRVVAERGLHFEVESNQGEFGRLLGIPGCCILAYVRSQSVAALKQNDFVPIVLENTDGPMPYNFWTNYVSQYFGRSLLSFFPCSFQCRKAVRIAKETFSVLRECDALWAEAFIRAQKNNILYTEYQGLHLFPGTNLSGWLDYEADSIQSTEITSVREQLNEGNRLRIQNKRKVEIYKDSVLMFTIEGDDVSVCFFN